MAQAKSSTISQQAWPPVERYQAYNAPSTSTSNGYPYAYTGAPSGGAPHPQRAYESRDQNVMLDAKQNGNETALDVEEEEMLKKGMIDWDLLKKKEFWLDKGMIKWYLLFFILIVLVVLMTFFHKQIINWLRPFVNKLRDLKAGWIIPIAIVFVLSFPPLFGQEIVLILVGLVWGLGEGFGIAAAGTVLGEIANFIVFKYWCTGRAEKYARKSLNYACLARVLRDGGFFLCWLSRLSALPTHFTTIVFAVSGFPFWKYCLALVLSLPKQLIHVYIGVVLGRTNATTNSRVISDSVFAVSAVITVVAAAFIYWKMTKVRVEVWKEMRAELANKGVPASHLPPNVDAQGHVI